MKTMAGWSSGRASIQQVRTNRDAGDGVEGAPRCGEPGWGGAGTMGSPEHHRRRAPAEVSGGQRRQKKNEDENGTGKRSRRTSTSPGSH
jgi:hypothetical protein